ncbi:MAG: hypothetical protein OXU45_01220 [Candidatus Melainabacteria bacterium]|nr:hypothetical protein [Candidatus Melainabacteria bacterium]
MSLTNILSGLLPAYDQELKEEEAKAAKEHRKAMTILELALTSSAASFNPNTDNLSPELKKLVEKIKVEMAESEKNTLDPSTLRQLISANIDSPSLRFLYNWILDRVEEKHYQLANKGIKVDAGDSFAQLEDAENNHRSVFVKAIDVIDMNPVKDVEEILTILA